MLVMTPTAKTRSLAAGDGAGCLEAMGIGEKRGKEMERGTPGASPMGLGVLDEARRWSAGSEHAPRKSMRLWSCVDEGRGRKEARASDL